MSIYKFREEDAIEFAKSINAQTKKHGDELQFKYCPYCKGGRGTNRDTYTFAINLKTGAFNCKRGSCGATGNMITLAKDFDFSLGSITDEYYRPRKQYRTFKERKEPIIPKEPAIRYLESRGISEETARKYEITTRNDHDNIS